MNWDSEVCHASVLMVICYAVYGCMMDLCIYGLMDAWADGCWI